MLLARLGRQPEAIFIKVGANDGVTDDPCGEAFLRSKCWRGLLVEPVPYCVEKLRSIYHESRFRIEPVAVASEPGEAQFFYVDERARIDLPDLPDNYDQVGSFNREHIIKHLDGVLEPYIRELPITVETLDQLIARHDLPRIDLLHIDTEGYDFEVLKGLDFSRYTPLGIYFEHKHLSDSDRQQVETLLHGHGYKVIDCGVDFLATHSEIDDRLR